MCYGGKWGRHGVGGEAAILNSVQKRPRRKGKVGFEQKHIYVVCSRISLYEEKSEEWKRKFHTAKVVFWFPNSQLTFLFPTPRVTSPRPQHLLFYTPYLESSFFKATLKGLSHSLPGDNLWINEMSTDLSPLPQGTFSNVSRHFWWSQLGMAVGITFPNQELPDSNCQGQKNPNLRGIDLDLE